MSEELKFQIRINLAAEFAEAARRNLNDPAIKPLKDILEKYDAVLKNQFDAFADYCRLAEEQGQTDTVLYKWTKDTIEKPGKAEQYATRFTVYADGGQEVYDEAVADGLEADLKALVESGMVTKISKIDSDPGNNPQAPSRFRM